jgi:signal transduction histidine kinase
MPDLPLADDNADHAGSSPLASTAVRILVVTTLLCVPFMAIASFAAPAERPIWDNIHWLISALGAALATAWSVRGATGRARVVRAAGAGVLGLWMLATVVWAWMTLTGTTTVPSFTDLFIIGMIFPAGVILVATVRGKLSAAEEAAVYLDGALVVLFVAALIAFVFGPTAIGLATSPDTALMAYPTAAAMAYPTAFIGLGGAGLVSALAIGYAVAPRGGLVFVIGCALIGFAYLGWISPSFTLTDPGEASSLLFTIGTLVAAYGSVTWREERSTNAQYLRIAGTASRIVGPLIGSLLSLLLLAGTPDSIDLIIHLLVFAGVIVLVIRQGLIVRERTKMLETVTELTRSNRRLVGELRRELKERTLDESRSIQAARADAVGFLSASVGHEVNNPLTGVLGYAELVLAELPADHPSRPDIETIRLEALRARQIVSSLRDFASPRAPNIAPTDLIALLARTVAAVRVGEGRGIAIAESYETMEPVPIDGGTIERAVANVLTNACNATPAGGHILVAARREGDEVLIVVTDDGIGLDAEAAQRAFEPFYSAWPATSSTAHAPGLGLSIADGLIGSHGGKIAIGNAPGRGTSVEIRLPAPCPRG